MLGKELRRQTADLDGYWVIGPSQATITKVKDVYRHVIYVKHKDYEALTRMKDLLEHYMEDKGIFEKAVVAFDFNPMIGY